MAMTWGKQSHNFADDPISEDMREMHSSINSVAQLHELYRIRAQLAAHLIIQPVQLDY
jgi:hypothetical protein